MQQWSYGILTFPLTRILNQLMRQILTSNGQMKSMDCRNIMKIESQSEYNSPKYWTAKHVLPFQG